MKKESLMKKEFIKTLPSGKRFKIIAEYKSLGSQAPYFSLTGEIGEDCFGCLHEEIERFAPDIAPMIKWHLVSEDSLMHYISNSMYWAQEGNLEFARKSAIWPEAELKDFTEENLKKRLPKLMEEFRSELHRFFGVQ